MQRAQQSALSRGVAGLAILATVACGAGCASPAGPPVGPAPPAAGAKASPPDGESASTPSAPTAQRRPLKPLKIQISAKSPMFSYLYLGRNLGLFEEHGFDVELIAMPAATASAALQANELDFMAAIGTATRTALRGLPLRVVFVESTGPDFVLVGAQALTGVDQLRGKIVAGAGPANNVNAMTTELLRASGITPSDYQIVNVGDNGPRAAALTQGIASAALLDIPTALPLLREG